MNLTNPSLFACPLGEMSHGFLQTTVIRPACH